jgi:hypothetical protein
VCHNDWKLIGLQLSPVQYDVYVSVRAAPGLNEVFGSQRVEANNSNQLFVSLIMHTTLGDMVTRTDGKPFSLAKRAAPGLL